MHKYFAKPLFLGKNVEFLPECHSTNDELNKRIKNNDISEGFLIFTDHQVKGKGQRGNAWVSEPGKNLLFSFLVEPRFLLPKQSYLLNIITGLAVLKSLEDWVTDKNLSLKWPNDVYIDDKKVSGILMETSIEINSISTATVGIGINVNQMYFPLPAATSLRIELNHSVDRESLLESVLVTFEGYYLSLKAGKKDRIIAEYYQRMRWRGEVHSFRADKEEFEGEIIGIDDGGKLILKTSNHIRRFDVKEITFLY